MTIIKLDAIDSTSSYLSALWRQGIFAPPVALYTNYQTAGRGRRGEQWQSEPHNNLTISFLLDYCSKDPLQSFALIMQTSLVVMQLLEQLEVPDLRFKLPNDIMSGSKKICGILVERALMGSQSSPFVVGVGINVNQERFDTLSHVTSVALETNQVQAVDDLARRLTALIEDVMTQSSVLEDQEYTSLLMRFEEYLYQKGNHCEVSIRQGLFETVKILGVNKDGRLKIQDTQLNVRLLDSADSQFNYVAK
jgi:BirA family biotin operon repressor/biotin-[acetyl-CoA-carboxylase] ligase